MVQPQTSFTSTNKCVMIALTDHLICTSHYQRIALVVHTIYCTNHCIMIAPDQLTICTNRTTALPEHLTTCIR